MPANRGDIWSFLRDVLVQGGAIEADYMSGRFASYEAYSARMDAASRERADELIAMIGDALRPMGIEAQLDKDE